MLIMLKHLTSVTVSLHTILHNYLVIHQVVLWDIFK